MRCQCLTHEFISQIYVTQIDPFSHKGIEIVPSICKNEQFWTYHENVKATKRPSFFGNICLKPKDCLFGNKKVEKIVFLATKSGKDGFLDNKKLKIWCVGNKVPENDLFGIKRSEGLCFWLLKVEKMVFWH